MCTKPYTSACSLFQGVQPFGHAGILKGAWLSAFQAILSNERLAFLELTILYSYMATRGPLP